MGHLLKVKPKTKRQKQKGKRQKASRSLNCEMNNLWPRFHLGLAANFRLLGF
jgi:hypothetical protein